MKYILFFMLIFTPCVARANEGHEHQETEKTTISASSAKTMNIKVDTAGPGKISKTISLTGKVTLNQNRVVQLRARFPGIVKDIKVNMGDKVTKGQTLAIVESNESLQAYPVVSPLDGVILARSTNKGDLAETEPMFVIADLTQLWAEFFIFSRDMVSITAGQKIRIKSLTDGTETEATVTTFLPTTESSSQTVVARVDLNNTDDKWRAGMTVRGDVTISEYDVPLAVKTTALQRQDNHNVVYIQKGDTYEAHNVKAGQSDQEWTEILQGINTGETYVSVNSFIIKADIAKSEAEHEH